MLLTIVGIRRIGLYPDNFRRIKKNLAHASFGAIAAWACQFECNGWSGYYGPDYCGFDP